MRYGGETKPMGPSMTTLRLETELPRSHMAPSLARRQLSDWLDAVLAPDEVHSAKLLISELVTNAVIHGQGEIALRAELNDERVFAEVSDQGHGFEYEVRLPGSEELHGRGLAVVDALSSRWGVGEGSTRVWFELERDAGLRS